MRTQVRDVQLLQSVVDMLNRQTAFAGGPDVRFTVSDSGIAFHLTRGTRTVTVDSTVTEEGDYVCVTLPRGRVATFKKAILNPTHHAWNN